MFKRDQSKSSNINNIPTLNNEHNYEDHYVFIQDTNKHAPSYNHN